MFLTAQLYITFTRHMWFWIQILFSVNFLSVLFNDAVNYWDYVAQVIDEWLWSAGTVTLTGDNWNTWRKPVPLLLFPTQIYFQLLHISSHTLLSIQHAFFSQSFHSYFVNGWLFLLQGGAEICDSWINSKLTVTISILKWCSLVNLCHYHPTSAFLHIAW